MPRTLRHTTEIDSRDCHFAVRIRNYRQALEHLRAQSVPLREKPQNPTPWAQIYVTDPDGNVMELDAERGAGAQPS